MPPSSTTTTTNSVTAHLAPVHGLPVGKIAIGLLGVGAVALLLIGIAGILHRRQSKRDFLSPGLYGVVGRMGAGKTYLLAHCAVEAQKRGRLVFANAWFKGASKVSCWSDVLDCPDNSLILLSEVHLWWPRDAYRAPIEVAAFFSQLRKRGMTVVWDSQHETFVSTRLIKLTFGIWACKRYKVGHQYTLFDGISYTGPVAKRERLARIYVKRTKEVMAAYDTTEIVGQAVEWGDGAGYEGLRVQRTGDARTSEPAQRSGRSDGRTQPVEALVIPRGSR